MVVLTHISTVSRVITARFQEDTQHHLQNVDSALSAGQYNPVHLPHDIVEQAEGGDRQVTDDVELLILRKTGQGREVTILVQGLEGRIVQGPEDHRDGRVEAIQQLQ
jgi:hypothetical protein